jgi:hypothetical protein
VIDMMWPVVGAVTMSERALVLTILVSGIVGLVIGWRLRGDRLDHIAQNPA